MTTRTANQVSMGFVLAGTLLMMSMAFDILPNNIALYAGLACFVMSGFVYGILRPERNEPGDSQPKRRSWLVFRRNRSR